MGLQLMASEEKYNILLVALLNKYTTCCIAKHQGSELCLQRLWLQQQFRKGWLLLFDQPPMMTAAWWEWGGCWYCRGSLLLSLARRASCKGCLLHAYRPTFQGLDQLSVWGLWMLLQPCPRHVPLADLVGGFSFTDHCPQCSTVVLDCTSFFSFTFTSSFKQSLQTHRTHLTS